jgi:phosphatidylserine decarboxylase
MTFKEALTTLPQYILPHHALSRMMRVLSRSKNKVWKNLFIKQIIRHYHVNMEEATEQNIEAYSCFNDFFIRALKSGIRPIAAAENAIACPADGAVSQAGDISGGKIFQAKGKTFNCTDLLGGSEERAKPFENGNYSTIYLAPKDYHRLHMPLTGKLIEMVHIPGRLFSVNAATAKSVPGLFARNERVACIFDTPAGPMALVLVGAIFVCSIETVWHGEVTPPTSKTTQSWQYQDNAPVLQKGEEMGRFNMGSTIIVLFGKDKIAWAENMAAGASVKLGQQIGTVKAYDK